MMAPVEVRSTPEIERAMQWALEDLLTNNKPPSPDDLSVIPPGSELVNILNSLTEALQRDQEIGLRRSFYSLAKQYPWLSELRSKEIPPRSGEQINQEQTKQNRYRPLKISELLAMPEQEWIINGFLYEDSISVVYGPPASSKSFLTFDCMACIALGITWKGRRTKRCRVIYLAAEGVRGYQRRVRAWCHYFGYSVDQLEDYLLFVPLAVPLSNFAEVHEFTEAIQDCISSYDDDLPVMIVLDTLFQCAAGMNINATDVMSGLVRTCQRIKADTNAAHVLIVHHSGKDELKGMSGNMALKASTDMSYRVTCDKDGLITLTTADGAGKVKDDEDITLYFQREKVTYGSGERDNSCIIVAVEKPEIPIKLNANQQLILDTLPDTAPGLRFSELQKALGKAKQTVIDNLNKLVDLRLIIKKDEMYSRSKKTGEHDD